MMPWTETHSPKDELEFVGNNQVIRRISDFISSRYKGKGLLLLGPSGIGKTSSVYLCAKLANLEVFEINASDIRNEKAIDALLGSAGSQQSLFGKGKVLLVDEVDGVSGTADRGGIPAICSVIEKSAYPVVLTAQDISDRKFSLLRKKTTLLEFAAPSFQEIKEWLTRICAKESVAIDPRAIDSLAYRAGADLRGALIDLETVSAEPIKALETVKSLDGRDKKRDIREALLKIFRGSDLQLALRALDDVSLNLDETLLWLEQNIPDEYKERSSAAYAFDALSKADIFKRRIMRNQNFRLMSYQSAYETAGVSIAKLERPQGQARYKQPGRLLLQWIYGAKFQARKKMAERIHVKFHVSSKKFIRAESLVLRFLAKKHAGFRHSFQKHYNLLPEDTEWMVK